MFVAFLITCSAVPMELDPATLLTSGCNWGVSNGYNHDKNLHKLGYNPYNYILYSIVIILDHWHCWCHAIPISTPFAWFAFPLLILAADGGVKQP